MTLRGNVTIDVGWGDCDPAEIVFYPNYFKWFDVGTHRLFDAAGLSFVTLREQYGIIGVPLLNAEASFSRPSRYGERIEIESWIERWERKTFRVAHRVHNAGEIAVEGTELRAWVAPHPDDAGRMRAVEIPAAIKAAFTREGP